jgi:hypothetical protein
VNINEILPQEWHGCFSELWRSPSNDFFLKDEKTWGQDWFGTTDPPKIQRIKFNHLLITNHHDYHPFCTLRCSRSNNVHINVYIALYMNVYTDFPHIISELAATEVNALTCIVTGEHRDKFNVISYENCLCLLLQMHIFTDFYFILRPSVSVIAVRTQYVRMQISSAINDWQSAFNGNICLIRSIHSNFETHYLPFLTF